MRCEDLIWVLPILDVHTRRMKYHGFSYVLLAVQKTEVMFCYIGTKITVLDLGSLISDSYVVIFALVSISS